MALDFVESKYRGLLGNIGKKAINALYPNDFELYSLAFELVNSSGDMEEFFMFPINPSSISESNDTLVNIKRNSNNITVLSNDMFNPTDIVLTGNFGRQFKFLMNQDIISFSAINFFKDTITGNVFHNSFKTGYGCYKKLESIINKSKGVDGQQNPYSLYFYNLALGNNYLVKPINITAKQDQQSSNMIWNYELTLKSIALIGEISNTKYNTLRNSTTADNIIQKAGTVLLNYTRKNLKV